MKRRWFLIGFALPVISVGCQVITEQASSRRRASDAAAVDGVAVEVARNSQTLVMGTAANYPPYEQVEGTSDNRKIVGFDIDLAELIAARLERTLSVVELTFGALIPAVMNNDIDMAMAALEPNRSRKQQVDFSHIYYRSRHSLVSFDGYLRSRDLNYQAIGVRAGSVQARFADRLAEDYPALNIVDYETIEDVFEALQVGAVEATILETNVAVRYLSRYPEFQPQVITHDRPTGSAIALAKNSPLRREINTALADIKASGEMERLVVKWFS